MNLAELAFAVGHELADLARSEADPRKRARAVRTGNAMFGLGRRLDAAPHVPMTGETWRAWAEPPERLTELRERNRVLALEVRMLRAELSEMRADAMARARDESERIDVMLRRTG